MKIRYESYKKCKIFDLTHWNYNRLFAISLLVIQKWKISALELKAGAYLATTVFSNVKDLQNWSSE